MLSVQGDSRKLAEAREGRPRVHLAPSALPGFLPALESNNLFPSSHHIAGASRVLLVLSNLSVASL